MLKVGLTGGIGSGKSTVAQVFEVLGIPVYYADDAAKKLMNENILLKEKLKTAFGEAVYTDGLLNRQVLSSIVFNDPAKLALLNSIVHPATILDAREWMVRQSAPYVIKEAALLFESGSAKQLDKIIGVYAPAQLRIHRVMQRDNITEKEVLSRLNKQMDEDEKMALCDYVIYNNGDQLVLPQVMNIHAMLLQEAEALGQRI